MPAPKSHAASTAEPQQGTGAAKISAPDLGVGVPRGQGDLAGTEGLGNPPQTADPKTA